MVRNGQQKRRGFLRCRALGLPHPETEHRKARAEARPSRGVLFRRMNVVISGSTPLAKAGFQMEASVVVVDSLRRAGGNAIRPPRGNNARGRGGWQASNAGTRRNPCRRGSGGIFRAIVSQSLPFIRISVWREGNLTKEGGLFSGRREQMLACRYYRHYRKNR